MNFLIISVAVFEVFGFFSLPHSVALSRDSSASAASQDPLKFILGSPDFGSWKNGISLAPGSSAEVSDYLVLAANRTKRPDILRAFKPYHGGWNITNNHYWASVGFTGAPGFILAAVWLLSFGSLLVVYHFCKWRVCVKAKGLSYDLRRICFILLIVFTCVTAVGCILLSVGQDKFHNEALHTLKYVVNQSDYTVEILQNVTQYLTLAKTINVTRISIPSGVMGEIDKLNVNLNYAAQTLEEKTSDNADKIKRVFYAVRSALITVATVMLILSFLGFYTCVAMKGWVDHPHAETALSSILPCVDQQTTNQTLAQSKVVINSIVTVVNTFVYAVANTNPSPGQDRYYNQSGPPMPPLCSPFDGNMEDRQCGSWELSMANASSVWENYVCEVSESGNCTTIGRVTPQIYVQLVAALNESYALEHYTPPLLSFRDCNFVRETFVSITSDYCPSLVRNLRIVNAGLGLISVGVLLCLVLWIFYANRPQREEVFADLHPQIKDGSFDNGLVHHHSGDESKVSVECV